MAIENSKNIVRRFVEFINTANKELAEELVHPEAVFYVPGYPEPLKGPEGYLMIIAIMRSGFPDIQWTIEDMVAEDNKVAVRYSMRGTHKGTFFGVPATNKSIVVE